MKRVLVWKVPDYRKRENLLISTRSIRTNFSGLTLHVCNIVDSEVEDAIFGALCILSHALLIHLWEAILETKLVYFIQFILNGKQHKRQIRPYYFMRHVVDNLIKKALFTVFLVNTYNMCM